MKKESQPRIEPNAFFCPACGAEIPRDAVRCWRCRSSFREGAVEAAANAENQSKYKFSATSIVLIIVIAAVLACIYVMAWGLGLFLTILAAPALVRTAYVSMYRGPRGRPLTFGEKASVFAAWLALGILALVAAGIAFFVTCLGNLMVGNLKNEDFIMGTSSLAAVVTATLCFAFFWWKLIR